MKKAKASKKEVVQTNRKKTAHRLIACLREVKSLIHMLRKDWKNLDVNERGSRLQDLVSRGCSFRGLEPDLDVSATTLRRHMKFLSTAEPKPAAVKTVVPDKKSMGRDAVRDRLRERLDLRDTIARPAVENPIRDLSDEVADIILDFCKNSVPEMPIRDYDLSNLLEDVRRLTRGELGPLPPSMQLPRKISLTELYRITRPAETSEDMWLGHRAIWLAKIVIAKAPEFDIREAAMNKAENRAGELGVTPTPEEAQQIKMQRRQFLSDGVLPMKGS